MVAATLERPRGAPWVRAVLGRPAADARPAPPDPAATDDLVSLEQVYATYHRQALGLAYRIVGNLADAEDVAQDALLTVWRARATYDASRGPLRAWLLRVVRNCAIDLLRARRRYADEPPTDSWADEGDLAGQVAAQVDGLRARRALAGLPREQRQAIELAYFEGLTHAEIAARTGAPLGTVKGRLRLGLDRLRVALAA